AISIPCQSVWISGLLLVLISPGLENSLRFFQLSLARFGQTLAAAIDEVLNHSNAGADPFGTDFSVRHRPGDCLGVLGKHALGRNCQNRLDVPSPLFFFW